MTMNPASRRARVVFFNRSYWPDLEATGQLLTQLTEDLADEFAVEVVVGQPNATASGVTYDRRGISERAGVTIRRLRHTRLPKHALWSRLTNLLSFTWAAGWTTFWLPRADVVVMQTDPLFLPFVGRWLQWTTGCRLVIYLQDIYPDIAVAVGKLREGWITRTLRSWLFGIYRRADRVVVLSRDMEATCLGYGVPAEKLRCLANWADARDLRPEKTANAFRQRQGWGDDFVVMYSGNLGLAHDLESLVEAATILRDEAGLRFVFVGEGAQRGSLERRVSERGLTNVQFLSYQPYSELSTSLSAADVQVVSLLPAASGLVMPSKLYGILATGTAVLVLADPTTELAETVRDQELGLVVDATDPAKMVERLVTAIRGLRGDPAGCRAMGERGRKLLEAEYDRPVQTGRFRVMLRELTGRHEWPMQISIAETVTPTGTAV
jgi:colanic acid biosynthesis glycosyl transferase WcaI